MRLPSKSIIATGALFIFVALFHIPVGFFEHSFDKNAPAQFISLISAAIVFLLIQFFGKSLIVLDSKVMRTGLALIAVLLFSALMSGNIIGALYGDSGRFVGAFSTLALLAIAYFHMRFDFEDFKSLLVIYLFAIEAVVLLGLCQHFGVVDFPGDQGITSTLGNSDFFAAFVATATPLFFLLWLWATPIQRIVVYVSTAINILALYLAKPLQAWVDLALTVLGVILYLARKKIPRRDISLNKRTYLGVLGIVIWAEIIFLMPFLGKFVPVLGNDIQVQIRGNFWIDGIRQFFSRPLWGVGPDQYGNHFEKFRTLDDLSKYPNILSNDAHSSAVQTLATLGLGGTLVYIALIAFVIRSILILWDNKVVEKKYLYAISLYLFVYLTNSFVSPITLSNKYIFWSICGFVVGRAYARIDSFNTLKTKLSSVSIAVIFLLIGGTFAHAQLTYLKKMEYFSANQEAKIYYQFNPVIPCHMYFDAEYYVTKNEGLQAQINLAGKQIAANPRCMSALIAVAKMAVNNDDVKLLSAYVGQLIEVAPYRADTLSIAMFYANRTQDSQLAATIQERMNKLGLVYVPGRLG